MKAALRFSAYVRFNFAITLIIGPVTTNKDYSFKRPYITGKFVMTQFEDSLC